MNEKKEDLSTLPLTQLEKRLMTSKDGLSDAEARHRLSQYGYNELEEKEENPLLKFLSYFWGPRSHG
jgi:H+-transporting ATPase